MKPLNVLLSAYACRPNMGSEPGVGWNTACEIARYENVWVITREDNRPSIESVMQAPNPPNLNIIYCDVPRSLRWFGKSGTLWHYYLWQICAYFTIRQLLPDLKLDVIHHITYVRYSTPSFLAFLPVPFIWGPVGGGESAPIVFWQDFDWHGKFYEILRTMIRWIGERDPFVAITARRSILANATTKETLSRLQYLGASNTQLQSQVGISADDMLGSRQDKASSSLRCISIGRLLHWKGFHLGLRAFAAGNLPPNSEYWIVGEGREKIRLQQLAQDLGIAESVKFLGNIPRQEVLEKLGQCHVLIHPSLHESGGFVCAEAMAVGCPVVCLDLGGPAVQVTAETGIKVAPESPEQVVKDMAIALSQLANDPEYCHKLGQAGQQRVNTIYNWQARGKNLICLYRDILEKKGRIVDKPMASL